MVAPMKRPTAPILPVLLALLPCTPFACGDDQRELPGPTPPPPASTGDATGPVPTSDDTTGGAVPCDAEQPCEAGQACAADYALGDPEPPAEAFTCRPGCIEPGQPLLWCLGDASCCEGTCSEFGLCGTPSEPTGSSTEMGSSSDTGSTTDMGSTTEAGSTTAGTRG